MFTLVFNVLVKCILLRKSTEIILLNRKKKHLLLLLPRFSMPWRTHIIINIAERRNI